MIMIAFKAGKYMFTKGKKRVEKPEHQHFKRSTVTVLQCISQYTQKSGTQKKYKFTRSIFITSESEISRVRYVNLRFLNAYIDLRKLDLHSNSYTHSL